VTAATVRWWSDDEGWGVLDAPEAPGGIFVHFSFIDADGYRSLNTGQRVELDLEGPLPFVQDGCRWRGLRVRPID
jgi:CspA family cold shock protein